MPDKFLATWVSHSSISDFLNCPRAYYINHVYKDPQTKHKVQLVSPPLALGGAVHEVLESISVIPTAKRFNESLVGKFQRAWKKVSGKMGGFSDEQEEKRYKERGEEMLRRVMNNPGPLKNPAVKINQELPQFWLSEEDNIILCGKIDWLEYLPESDSVHIIDFKTSKKEESDDSLQLPIYHLLVDRCQKRKVDKASYWYVGLHDEPIEKPLPDLDEAATQILRIAKQIKLARQLEKFSCPKGEGGCFACRPLEKILNGQAEKVGVSGYNQDLYVVLESSEESGSTIL